MPFSMKISFGLPDLTRTTTLPVTGHGTNFQVVFFGLPTEKPSALNAGTLRSRWPPGFCWQGGFEFSGHASMIVTTTELPPFETCAHAPQYFALSKFDELMLGMAAK